MDEEIKSNHIDSILTLHENNELDSNELEEQYMITFTNEDDINFKILADNGENQFIIKLKMTEYINMKEKDFISRINNFNLLLETIQKALDKNKVILSKINDSLNLTFHYINIYDEKQISFELTHQKSEDEINEKNKEKEESENNHKEPEEIVENKNEVEYKAEIIEYNKKFEEYGDRNIIRVLIENKGSHPWPKEKTSFRCSQEYSSLICKEYFLEDSVSPGEQIELAIEFLKNQKENLKPPYITFLNLHVHPKTYEPLLVLDFSESYNNTKIPFIGPEIKLEEEDDDTKPILINDVNIFNETKNEKKENNQVVPKIVKKGKTIIKKKVQTKMVETDSGPKEMTPFQRRIYELNQKEKNRVEQEKERQKKTGWKKNF